MQTTGNGPVMYVGPTITGLAVRNTVYDGVPASVNAAAKSRPYLRGLCVPIPALAEALHQIARKSGAAYNLYRRALDESRGITQDIQRGE